jgi:hypothetical protein
VAPRTFSFDEFFHVKDAIVYFGVVNAIVAVADVEHAISELILRREELAWIASGDLRNVLTDNVFRQHLLANARKRPTFAQ